MRFHVRAGLPAHVRALQNLPRRPRLSATSAAAQTEDKTKGFKMKDWNGNEQSVFKIIGASNHLESEREESDYYATDPIAVDKLLSVVTPHNRIWECACGSGHLSERLTEKGFYVCSSDIKDRGYKRLSLLKDFLKATHSPFSCDFDILTNPPYKFAKEFVLKSLNLLPAGCRCFMFLKLTFLEGKARYEQIFKTTPPKAIYVFSERVMCAKNGDFEGLKTSGGSAVAYAWFVWEKGYKGKTELSWI